MAGYAGRKEPAEGTEQNLFGKMLAIEDRDAARQAWRDAMDVWQRAELIQIGPGETAQDLHRDDQAWMHHPKHQG